MRAISYGIVATACVALVSSAAADVRGQSNPASEESAGASVPIDAFSTHWSGWFYWRCWDEAQRIALELTPPRSEAGPRRVMPGREAYEVGRIHRSVPVEVTVDLKAGTFTLIETDIDREGDAEASHPGPFIGRLSPDGRHVRPAHKARASCEPELVLDALAAPAPDELPQPATISDAAQAISLRARLVD